jgi:hypothetical protein
MLVATVVIILQIQASYAWYTVPPGKTIARVAIRVRQIILFEKTPGPFMEFNKQKKNYLPSPSSHFKMRTKTFFCFKWFISNLTSYGFLGMSLYVTIEVGREGTASGVVDALVGL